MMHGRHRPSAAGHTAKQFFLPMQAAENSRCSVPSCSKRQGRFPVSIHCLYIQILYFSRRVNFWQKTSRCRNGFLPHPARSCTAAISCRVSVTWPGPRLETTAGCPPLSDKSAQGVCNARPFWYRSIQTCFQRISRPDSRTRPHASPFSCALPSCRPRLPLREHVQAAPEGKLPYSPSPFRRTDVSRKPSASNRAP